MSKKRNYRGKSKGKDFKKKDGSKTFLTDGNPNDGLNDIQWWNENPALLQTSSALSYGNIAGLDLDFNFMADANGEEVNEERFAVPGIMALQFTPIIGVSKDGNSPVNNASRLVYSYIRHANSGSRNYEQSDYFTYLLAVSNLLTAHAELVRLYGCMQVYNKMNRYIGKALVTALGYNFDDIINNLATLRYGINALAVRINSFAIPKSMHIFARHISLVTNVFKDAKDTKSQLYIFKPRQYFKWSAVDNNGNPGSSLEPIMAPNHNTLGVTTVAEALKFVSDLIDALSFNEDCGLMSGDTLKAFSDTGIYHINAIPENYIIDPVYDEVILSQIHNAECYNIGNANVSSDKAKMWVTQSDNNIIYNPQVINPYNVSAYNGVTPVVKSLNKILDSGMDIPTPEFNMEATRLKAGIMEGSIPNTYYFDSIGTEIINDIVLYSMQNGIVQGVGILHNCVWNNYTAAELFSVMSKMAFDWAPLQYFIQYNATLQQAIVSTLGEMFNYTLIDNTYLSKVHNAALLSALNVYSLAMSK